MPLFDDSQNSLSSALFSPLLSLDGHSDRHFNGHLNEYFNGNMDYFDNKLNGDTIETL